MVKDKKQPTASESGAVGTTTVDAVAFLRNYGLIDENATDLTITQEGKEPISLVKVIEEVTAPILAEIESLNKVLAEKTELNAETLAQYAAISEALKVKTSELKDATTEIASLTESFQQQNTALKEALAENERLTALIPVTEEVPEPEPEEPPVPFEYNGRKYGFTHRAPKTISFGGVKRTQKELLNDSEAMQSLIVGGSAFVKQIV